MENITETLQTLGLVVQLSKYNPLIISKGQEYLGTDDLRLNCADLF